MSPVPDTIQLTDTSTGFEELLRSALTTVQEQAGRAATSLDPGGAWTDHNTHDPGITLLEAALWALADLHFRTDDRRWEAWPAEAAVQWRGAVLPDSARAALESALETQRSAILAAIASSPSRTRAVTAVRAATGLDARAAAGAIRLVREPHVLRLALDRADAVAAALEGSADPDAALAAALDGAELWPEEIADLVVRARRRALVRRLRERPDQIRAAVDAVRGAADPASAVAAALAALGFDRTALSVVPCPPVPAETWEREPGGETTLWPPHPLQVRTCEPVTAGDYVRLFQSDAEVARAWLVPGLAVGRRWNGTAQTTARPYRVGALTIVVEPVASEPPSTFLRSLLRRVLGRAEVDAAGGLVDHRATVGAASPRRLLGDELCVARVVTVPVEVEATLEIEPSGSEAVIRAEAGARLGAFLSAARLLPPDLAPAPPIVRRLVCPDELEGPLPPPAALAEFLADPDGVERESGWRPGEPIRVTEVAQLLQAIPGVAGVELLGVRKVGTGPWQRDQVELERFSVPRLADTCLCVAVVQRRECGD